MHDQEITVNGPVVVEAETVGKIDSRVVAMTAPLSAAAEQFRLLALRIEAAARQGCKKIAITSATVGEGKTLTAVNVALALGRGRRNQVTLVDCDLRAQGKGSVHQTLGLEPLTGMADVLDRKSSLDNTLWRFGDDDLWVMPAGKSAEPHVSIGSRRMGELLDEMARRSDIVIIDTPPVLPTADVQALARHVDAVVLVIRAGKTPREVVNMALDALALAEVRVLGCVLSGIEAEAGMAHSLLADHDRRQKALPARRS